MKKALLASLLAAGLVSSAFAGVAGDLVMGFRDTATATGTNVTFDLGNFSNYSAGGTFASGGTVDTGINVSTLLGSTYGNSFASDSSLFWGVVGTNGNGPTQKTLFVSAAATSPGSSSPYLSRTANSQGSQASIFATLETNTTAAGVTALTTSATSWSHLETSALAFGAYQASAFESISGAGLADLYVNAPTNSTGVNGTYLGTFSISATNGDVLFTTAAIPEPSVYAAILGAATLGFAALRRRKQALLA